MQSRRAPAREAKVLQEPSDQRIGRLKVLPGFLSFVAMAFALPWAWIFQGFPSEGEFLDKGKQKLAPSDHQRAPRPEAGRSNAIKRLVTSAGIHVC